MPPHNSESIHYLESPSIQHYTLTLLSMGDLLHQPDTSQKWLAMVLPPLIKTLILPVQELSFMPGNTSQSHRISKYLKCTPKVFSILVYVGTITSPYFPTSPLSINLQILFASITELSSTLLNTSVVNPLFNDLLRLMYYPTSTPSVIKPTSSSCILLNTCWNLS